MAGPNFKKTRTTVGHIRHQLVRISYYPNLMNEAERAFVAAKARLADRVRLYPEELHEISQLYSRCPKPELPDKGPDQLLAELAEEEVFAELNAKERVFVSQQHHRRGRWQLSERQIAWIERLYLKYVRQN